MSNNNQDLHSYIPAHCQPYERERWWTVTDHLWIAKDAAHGRPRRESIGTTVAAVRPRAIDHRATDRPLADETTGIRVVERIRDAITAMETVGPGQAGGSIANVIARRKERAIGNDTTRRLSSRKQERA